MPEPSFEDTGTLPGRAPRGVRLALVFVLYAIVGSFVTDAQMTRWGLGWYDPSSEFSRLLDRTADRPYVYRVLTPSLVKLANDLLPEPIEAALLQPRGEKRLSLAARAQRRYAAGADSDPITHYLGYLIVLVSAIGGCWVWRLMLSGGALPVEIPRPPPALVDCLPALGFLLLPLTFGRGGYPYDMPQLLLVSMAFLFFLSRRFGAYYCLFVVAMFNKESSLLMAAWFLPPALLSARWLSAPHLAKGAARRHLALHAILGIPILGWLYWHYRDNGGGPVEWHLVDNLSSYLDPRSYLHMVDIYSAGVPMPQGFHVLNLLLFGYLLLHAWSSKSTLVRSSFAAAVLTVAPLFLAFGFRDEIRVFEIAFPAAFLLGCDTAMRVWRVADPGS